MTFLMKDEELEREDMISGNKINFRDRSVPGDSLMRYLLLFQEK